MIAITYTITLQEPLLATSLQGDPNSAVSAAFIPGSMVRGLLINQQRDNQQLVLTERELFFAGQVRYLHAYPIHPETGHRGLPTPLSWRKNKRRVVAKGIIEDRALLEKEEGGWSEKSEDDAPVTGSFVWLAEEENQVITYTPATQVTIHTQRDRGPGRARRGAGAVYQYEALAAGERFQGVILCTDAGQATQIKDMLSIGVSYLGGAQTAGYGRVVIDAVQEKSDWQETTVEGREIDAGETLVITLLSDAILRADNGVTHTNLLAAIDLPLSLEKAFKAVVPLAGFNRKWGLPLPQTEALAAGSVFVCRTQVPISPKQLSDWQESGVGERRIEGFGRLAFNWQVHETLQQSEFSAEVSGEEHPLPPNPTDPAYQLAQRMVARQQRQALDQALLKAVRNMEIENIQQWPPNSQLASVRIIARHALQAGNVSRISSLFKPKIDNQDNPAAIKLRARQRFDRARLGQGKRLAEWIIELTDTPAKVWEQLEQKTKTLGNVYAEGDLAVEYAVRLIDSVLARVIAERRNAGQKQGGNGHGTA